MAYVELTVDQGTSFENTLDLLNDDGTPYNLTNCSLTGQLRKSYYSSNATANLTINVITAANGNANITMNAATTTNITAGRYLYDIKLTDANNNVTRIVEGILTITPQVTK